MTSVGASSPAIDHLQKCRACGHRGCDIGILGCGCTLHARCTPVLPFGCNAKCPKCQSPCSGVHVFPLSFSDLDEAQNKSSGAVIKKATPILSASRSDLSNSAFQPSSVTSIKRKISEVDGISPNNVAGTQHVYSPEAHGTFLAGDRAGRWTPEELAYVNCLVGYFDSGRLLLVNGMALIDFLSGMLKCKASRFTKKFKNSNMTRGYVCKLSGRPCSSMDLDDNLPTTAVFSRTFENFACSFPSALLQAEVLLVTSAQWRKHLMDFCFQRTKQLPVCLFQHAEEYLRSVDELDRRSAFVTEEKVKRRKLDVIAASNRTMDSGIVNKGCVTVTQNQNGLAFETDDSMSILGLEDLDPVPVNSLRKEGTGAALPDVTSTFDIGKGRTSTVSLGGEDEDSGVIILDENSTTDEEFLTLWGFHGSDGDAPAVSTVSCPNDSVQVHTGGNGNVPVQVYTGGHGDEPDLYKSLMHFTHITVAGTSSKNSVTAISSPAAAAESRFASLPSTISATAITTTKRPNHPFLANLLDYAQATSLPFDYFDLWVPSFVDDGGDNAFVSKELCHSSKIVPSSNVPFKNMRLIYAGHITVNTGDVSAITAGGVTTPERLAAFGEYSSNFQFESNQGMPGRVHFTCLPCWEQSVNYAPRDHFPRVQGAALVGIRTAVGIPVTSGAVGTIVVGCYSTRDLRKNDELVGRLWKDFGGWNPVPTWKLVLNEGRGLRQRGSLLKDQKEAADRIFSTVTSSSKERPNGNCSSLAPCTSKNYGVPNEGSSVDTGDSAVEREILKLLAEYMPLPDNTDPLPHARPTPDTDYLLRGYMSLRLLILRLRSKRCQAEIETLSVICSSYRGYTKKCPAKKWSRKEICQVLVREYMFLTQAIQATATPPGANHCLRNNSVVSAAQTTPTSLDVSVPPASSPILSPSLVTPPGQVEPSQGTLMHPISPVSSSCKKE